MFSRGMICRHVIPAVLREHSRAEVHAPLLLELREPGPAAEEAAEGATEVPQVRSAGPLAEVAEV